MAHVQFTADFLGHEARYVEESVRALSGSSDPKKPPLPESRDLAFLADKLVLLIVCGFVSPFLYHKYMALLQTKAQADEAQKELVAHQCLNAENGRVEDKVMEQKLIEMLVEAHLPEEDARRVVSQALQRIKLHRIRKKLAL